MKTAQGSEGVDVGGSNGVREPQAQKRPHRLEIHGDVRVDDYYWLRERDDPEVLSHLEAENAYTESSLDHLGPLRESLYEEMKQRYKPDDDSVPYLENGYWYRSRFESGKEYPLLLRRRDGAADETLMLDINALADGHEYTAVAGVDVGDDNRLLAYSVDHVGRRQYTIRVRDLETGKDLDDEIELTTGNLRWGGGSALYYVRQHPETLRPYQIYRHVVGEPSSSDQLLLEEDDEEFYLSLGRSKSRAYLIATASQTERTEVHVLRADQPEQGFQVFEPRSDRHEYQIDHVGDRFFIRTNTGGPNFHLMSSSEEDTARAAWSEVTPHSDTVFFEGFEVFADRLACVEREGGLPRLRVRDLTGSLALDVDFPEPTYALDLGANPSSDSAAVRIVFSSPRTPRRWLDVDLGTGELKLLKQLEVPGGFDASHYETELLMVTARDGTRVPVSLLRRSDQVASGPRPTLMYGYGAYGVILDASFDPNVLSLVDRGFTYALTHLRGGQELGYRWYEQGKLFHKMNTFTDFIDVAEHLCASGASSPDRLFARGGSAGGLLMGAITNLRPDLFRGVLAGVPFVDVVTTMLDTSIPLTTFEWREWGDPREEEAYRYMLSYSPYDNVEAKDYPNLLVLAGLHDSQVQYWEPAKWVAKLRDLRTNANRLLLKTNMSAGHSGASGRYQRLVERALEYAFVLDLLPTDVNRPETSS